MFQDKDQTRTKVPFMSEWAQNGQSTPRTQKGCGDVQKRLTLETDLPVLLLGETGTGKTSYAERIHQFGRRREGPFVSVNVAELTGELFAAELFGYVRGAFTGALTDRVGLIEAAHGGTLFLDEIGELSLEQQAKLLRVLETRRVRRVGATNERVVDFRLIVATNRDLESEVRAGRFRADLYHRLASVGVVIRLRSIKEMSTEERLVGCARLIGEINERLGGQIYVSERLCRRLIEFEWAGNWREFGGYLQRMISIGMLLGGGRGILDVVLNRGEARHPEELFERLRVLPLREGDHPHVTVEVVEEPEHKMVPIQRRRGRPRKNSVATSSLEPPKAVVYGQIVAVSDEDEEISVPTTESVANKVQSTTTSAAKEISSTAEAESFPRGAVKRDTLEDHKVREIYEDLRRAVREGIREAVGGERRLPGLQRFEVDAGSLLGAMLRAVEEEILRINVERCGSYKAAADRLGISRSRIYRVLGAGENARASTT